MKEVIVFFLFEIKLEKFLSVYLWGLIMFFGDLDISIYMCLKRWDIEIDVFVWLES